MTVCQTPMSEHPAFSRLCLVELPAGEDKRRQIIFDLLCKGQQLLCIAFLLPCLPCNLPLQSLLLNQELLILAVLEQIMQSHCALSLRSFHRCQYSSPCIDSPTRVRFSNLLPELFPCAGKSLRKMCILLKCYHLFLFFLSHKNFYCHTDITDLTDFFIKNLRIREFYCNDKNFCFAMN